MATTIGLMVGREWSFPPAFVEEVSRQNAGFEVEYVKLGTPASEAEVAYPVILDRIAHAVPFYRSWLKHATLKGTRVVNDPFVEETIDRFVAQAIAEQVGVATPKMMALPHREYSEGIIHEESLRNLDYPLDWEAVLAYVGIPSTLKDASGSSETLRVCNSVDELLAAYNNSGRRQLVVQERLHWQQFVRCLVVGDGEALVLPYQPGERRYNLEGERLPAELSDRVAEASLRLTRALGYDINAIDWAIRDGEPYAVEMVNPQPEIDIYSLTSTYFEWVVARIAALVISTAEEADAGVASRSEEDGDLAEDLPSLARDLPHSDLQP